MAITQGVGDFGPQRSESVVPDSLGSVGNVECWVARTDWPWLLDLHTIVLSVGMSLGTLGLDVKAAYPHAPWESIDFSGILPDRPADIPLGASNEPGARLRHAILATPSGVSTDPDPFNTITVATVAALRRAADLGAPSVGIPLLATGVLGLPALEVALVTLPAVVDVLRGHPGSLEQVYFLCQDAPTEAAIRSAWMQIPTTSENTEPVAESTATTEPTVIGNARREFATDELAGGVSTDLVDPNVGIPLTADRLGVSPYVSMLATMIADRRTPLPLSIGVFGEWGSGKSYFMGMLRQQVAELAASGDPSYCMTVEQIGFNAWHYADSNLWASLGDEIFRQLAEPRPDAEQSRQHLRIELARLLDQRQELAAATKQAEAEAAALRAQVDRAAANRESGAKRLLAALRDSEEFRQRVNRLWARLGIADEVEQGRVLADQLRGTLTEADALRRSGWERLGKTALAAAVVVLVAGAFAALLAPAAREWLAGVGGVFAAMATGGIGALARARSGLRALRALSDELHAGTGLDHTGVSDTVTALRQAEAAQQVAEAQLHEVVSRIGELGRQLTELSPGRRLYSFLADRAHGDSYTSHLGLISTIRKDFEQLVALMRDWRENPEKDGTVREPIDRIVLYIDDLDRCSPEQVVDVLQAVHLLLALDLFVVVVGVDPRWLLRSLNSRYETILDGPEAGSGHANPEDYLEKIVNIPMVLPGMGSGSLLTLLRSMADGTGPAVAEPAAAATGVPAAPETTPSTGTPLDPFGPFPVEEGSELRRQAERRPVAEPRPLTEREINLLAALESLIDTPRDAKRLMNLYRMLRSTRDLSDASRFLGDDGRPGEYEAVAVLLGMLTAHARLLGQVLDSEPDRDGNRPGGLLHRDAGTPWPEFVADLEPRQPDGHWTNPIRGDLAEPDVRDWRRLHDGMMAVAPLLTTPNLAPFQLWSPRIRRFSYVLPPGT